MFEGKGCLKPQIVPNTTRTMFLAIVLPFHFKEVLSRLSLAYATCQHHVSCTSVPSLGKIRVT